MTEIDILHVDDDPSIADLTKTFLEREDNRFSVETATSPDEGLEILGDRAPDCIVSDYEMPGTNGIDFLESVRETHPNLPFILYTGRGSEEVASEAISAGVTDYLQKESGTDQYTILANRITNAVAQSHAEQEVERTREYYRHILEHASDYLMIVDEQGGIDYVSPSVERVMGYTPDELDGADAFELTHPDDRTVALEVFSDVLEQPEQEHAVEYRARHADGSWRWLEVRGRNLLDNHIIGGVLVSVRNITERVEHQQELERQNDLFAKAQDIADVGGWEYNLETERLRWTEQVYRIHGLSNEYEPTQEKAIEFYHPNDRDTIREAFERAVADGEAYDVTLRLITADGETQWVHTRGTPQTEGGETVRIRGTIQDITEQRENQKELERERQLIQQALDSLNELFYVLNDDGSIRRWNEFVSEVTGYDDSEIAQMNAIEFFPTDQRETVTRAVERTLSEGQATAEAELLTAGGQRIPYELTGARLTDGEGNTTGVVGIGRDISARKEREQKISALHDVADHLASSESVAQVCERTVEASQRILAFDLSVIAIESDGMLSPVAVSEDISTGGMTDISVDEGIAGKTYRSGNSFLLDDATAADEASPQGPYRSAISVPIGDHGNFQAVDEAAGVFDESDLELAELLISHTESALDRLSRERELQRQNERLDRFASVVSHDLRNPLNVASGSLELARQECDSPELDRIERAHDRMERLIADILTLARDGEQIRDMESVELVAVAEQSWETVSTAEATLDADVERTIRADRSRLQQLLENLFRNAIDHGGKDVTVSVGKTEAGFYVADTGFGIPDSDREAVLEAGYSTADDGTGFGLSIVEGIAEAHGWEVTVTESEQGGARFEIAGVETVD